jgi:5-hydroxyisourate hydrolase-like protein (transthyretin family)
VNIEENPLTQMNFNIVPNPTSNDRGVNVEYVANEKPVTFELIDLQGKVLSTETNQNTNGAISHTLKLNNQIEAGYYTLRISQGQYVSNKKLIVQ